MEDEEMEDERDEVMRDAAMLKQIAKECRDEAMKWAGHENGPYTEAAKECIRREKRLLAIAERLLSDLHPYPDPNEEHRLTARDVL